MSEHRSPLSNSNAATSSSSSSSAPTASLSSTGELTSFPCLSASTSTLIYDSFMTFWSFLQRVSPSCFAPVFARCEVYEMMGATLIVILVALCVVVGYMIVFPSLIHLNFILRFLLQSFFTLQVVIGYACLFLFRLVDPGYLPPNEGEIDRETAELLSRPEYQTTSLIATRPFVPSYTAEELEQQRLQREQRHRDGQYSDDEETDENGVLINSTSSQLQQEWCRSCRIWRPPRCGHCYKCGHCVLRLDHHCVMLGNCVGVKNHRFFLVFVALVGTGSMTLLISTLIWLLQSLIYIGFFHLETFLSFLLLLPFALASCTLFLSYFHFKLLYYDITMREKYGRKRRMTDIKNLRARDIGKEIWKEIFIGKFEWKGETRGVKEEKERRRKRVMQDGNGYRSVPQPQQGEEQVGCTGVEGLNNAEKSA